MKLERKNKKQKGKESELSMKQQTTQLFPDEEKEEQEQPNVDHPTLQPSKPRKKSFSLKCLSQGLKPSTSTSTSNNRNVEHAQTPLTAQQQQKKQLPTWLTCGKIDDLDFKSDPDRSFACEFFQDAVSFTPSSKSKINSKHASLALESAVNEQTLHVMNDAKNNTKNNASSDPSEKNFRVLHWEKVHDVVASIRGKHDDKPGSIVPLMLDGHFPTAHDIVKLSRRQLHQSFEGKFVVNKKNK